MALLALVRGVPAGFSGGALLAEGAYLAPASSTLPLVASSAFGEALPLTLLATLVLLFAICGAVALAKSA